MNFNLTETIKILSKTPNLITELLSDLSDEWIYTNEGVNTWSPYDIVGHLIYGEKTDWIPRAKIILSDRENKTFEPFDRFAQMKNSEEKSINELLNEFRELRKENIECLERMKIDKKTLEGTGVHPELGIVTLKQLLSTWLVHDLSHINQMTRVLATNCKNNVGPWKAYISIIK